MADLTLLQIVGLITGTIAGTLGIIKTVQSWRKNRPLVSVMLEDADDRTIEIEIKNPASRPVTITRSRCVPGRYALRSSDYTLYIDGAKQNDLPHSRGTAEVGGIRPRSSEI